MYASSPRFNWVYIGLLLTSGAISGCGPSGPPRVEISGSVTLDGAPLESGSIAFIPEEGVIGPMAGGEINKGVYRIAPTDGPTIGPHKVEIRAWREAGQVDVKGVANSTGGPSGGGAVAQMEMYVSADYNTNSKLHVAVEQGENQHDFDIESIRRASSK